MPADPDGIAGMQLDDPADPDGVAGMQLDDPVYNHLTDAPRPMSRSPLSSSSDLEYTQDETAMFNLDDNGDSDCARSNLPPATLESLASTQKLVKHIEASSFDAEERQWNRDEFQSFLHPPHDKFCLDDLQLRLSLKIYISLSAHSSEATYDAVRRSIKECYPDNTMLSFDQIRNHLKSLSGVLPLHFDVSKYLYGIHQIILRPQKMSIFQRRSISEV